MFRVDRLMFSIHATGTLIPPIIQAMEFDQKAEDVARAVFYMHAALTEVVENALLDALT